jgi:uncharacterized protein YacL
MFDYLYYKIYRAVLRSSLRDIPAFVVPVYVGGLFSLNLIIISAFFAKLDIAPFLFQNKIASGIFVVLLMAFLYMRYNSDKRDKVLQKFAKETAAQRIRGNLAVITYVSLSFISIFLIAFYKPGKF